MDISFQMYSARNAPSYLDVFQTLANLGYSQVEGYFGLYEDAPNVVEALQDTGLTMPSGHFGVADLETNLDATLATARTLGIRHVVAPYLDEADRPKDTAGYRAFAARLAELQKKVYDQGFTFAWHNHEFEFEALPDGTIPMELLLQEVPELLWEADLAWVVRAKADPNAWLTRFGARTVAIHVKDIAPDGQNTDEDGWADVGHGVVDWATLIATARTAAPDALMVLEHDNPSDITRFAQNSITAFKTF